MLTGFGVPHTPDLKNGTRGGGQRQNTNGRTPKRRACAIGYLLGEFDDGRLRANSWQLQTDGRQAVDGLPSSVRCRRRWRAGSAGVPLTGGQGQAVQRLAVDLDGGRVVSSGVFDMPSSWCIPFLRQTPFRPCKNVERTFLLLRRLLGVLSLFLILSGRGEPPPSEVLRTQHARVDGNHTQTQNTFHRQQQKRETREQTNRTQHKHNRKHKRKVGGRCDATPRQNVNEIRAEETRISASCSLTTAKPMCPADPVYVIMSYGNG